MYIAQNAVQKLTATGPTWQLLLFGRGFLAPVPAQPSGGRSFSSRSSEFVPGETSDFAIQFSEPINELGILLCPRVFQYLRQHCIYVHGNLQHPDS